jgi:hypothetical protein
MKEKYLDIDFLKNNHKRLYYFGLGFVQLILDEKIRLHFYNVNIKNTNDEIHNHRYNFKSTVLKGNLVQQKYQLIDGNTHYLKNETCGKNINLVNTNLVDVSILNLESKIFNENDTYSIFFNEFHDVSYKENTITLLERSSIILDYAQVIYPKNSKTICPFSKTYTNDELFDIIYDTIKK